MTASPQEESMYMYVTFFSVGKGSETLSIDQFPDNMGESVRWTSSEEYFAARIDYAPIDGGVFTYGLALATSAAPDAITENRIVSYLPTTSFLDLLGVLNSVVRAMRSADWPEWEEE